MVYIKIHLKTRFIWPPKCPADTPTLFDTNSDESLQLLIDYWRLNNLTIKNWYLFSLIGNSLDRLGHAKWFIYLEHTSPYHQMRIEESGKWEIVFFIRYSYFEYLIMFFSFFNAPSSFQKYINKILVQKLNIFVIVYLNEIFVYIKNLGQLFMDIVC